MMANVKITAKWVAVLLAVCIEASAQQDASLVYSGPKRLHSSYRVKVSNGLVEAPGTLVLERGQVTIRNKSGTDDIVIPDQQLLDAVDEARGRSMPYIRLSTAFQCDDAREAAIFLSTAVAWDAVVGVVSLFHHKRHFLTINYVRDGETRSETVQVSGRDAQKLVKELQLRRGIAFVPGEF